jgi:tetratricopeptide (TPR) repeat protein
MIRTFHLRLMPQTVDMRRGAARSPLAWALATVLALVTSALCGAQTQPALSDALQELFSQGVEAQKEGRLDDAEKVFREVLARGGKVAFVHNNLGAVYQMRREHEKAVAQFREAIRMQPDYAAPRILAGASLLVLGKVNEATVQLERAVKLQPKDRLVREQLVRAYEMSGNFRGLVEQYRALVELAPDNPEYVYQLGNAYLGFAAWCHREIGALGPDSARIHQTVAEKFLAEGHADLAARAYRRAAELDPSLPEIHFSIALIYLEQGKPTEALEELEKELAIVPYSAAALSLREKIRAGGGSNP